MFGRTLDNIFKAASKLSHIISRLSWVAALLMAIALVGLRINLYLGIILAIPFVALVLGVAIAFLALVIIIPTPSSEALDEIAKQYPE